MKVRRAPVRALQPTGQQPLRIAFVMGGLEIGGTETQVCRLAAEMQRRGHIVEVTAMAHGGPLAEHLASQGVPFRIAHFSGLSYRDQSRRPSVRVALRSISDLIHYWRTLWRFRPDVCHVFLPGACNLTLPGAALGRIPVRISGRRSLPSQLIHRTKDRPFRVAARWSTNVIVANSQAVADDLLRTERVGHGRLHVIPNGVDIPESPSNPMNVPPVGIVVANLIAYKGHEDLIAALRMLPDPPRMRFVGDGPERSRLETLARDGGLAQILEFEGTVVNAKRLFAEAQFAVLASHQEGMPNAVLEAMAFGLPVIATAVGGVPELIEDEVTGLLVPPHSPSTLASALLRVISDPDLRRDLGSAARERAKELSWEQCVEAHERVYFAALLRRSSMRSTRAQSRLSTNA